MYTYIKSEPGLWTVGFYEAGKWHSESDHNSTHDAAKRVAYLNGSGVVGYDILIGEIQSGVDRILRDKGMSNKDIYDAINDVAKQLKPQFANNGK